MRIDIDDALMAQVMESGEFRTRKAAVEESLRLLMQARAQGRLHREGCLDDMRRDR